MAIRDFLTRKIEDFMKALTTLVHYKNTLQFEKALDFIEEQKDLSLLQAMEANTVFGNKDLREAIEFQLKLSYHELEILKTTEQNLDAKKATLLDMIDKFLLANEGNYYMELSEMKKMMQ